MYTGNTEVLDLSKVEYLVYPCVYREHTSVNISLKKINGLSLCIQGTHLCIKRFCINKRFIPVYTGNTVNPATILSWRPVYPCVYREHNDGQNWIIIKSGLSLCIQGTLIKLNAGSFPYRFIPVYTGNTPIITYCFIIKILTVKFLPIF